MDSLTHLVAGALTPMAFKNAPKTRMMILFGIICGEFPDIDVIAGKTPEAILAFHRGATHALAAQPLFALLLALVFHRLIKKGDAAGTWTFAKTWSVALAALLIHLFLDSMTTFGTQIFLPFSDLRVALPAMYIIDLAMTLPLLAVLGIILAKGGLSPANPAPEKARTRLARGGLVWLVAYPLLALGLNYGLASHLTREYAGRGNKEGITRVELSPEPFAPLNWKFIGIAPDAYYMGRYFLLSPGRDIPLTAYARPDGLFEKAREAIPLFRLFDKFATYAFETVGKDGSDTVHTFADVRYEATLPALMNALGRGDGIFLMQIKTRDGDLAAYRFLYRGRDAATTQWEPVPKAMADARKPLP
ncbi:MAG: metal-dependent hydrolase [Deltaproteobacteria bacterium]|nr:metal-dependent hydrolase [Deltaproteobacteria bacterium]